MRFIGYKQNRFRKFVDPPLYVLQAIHKAPVVGQKDEVPEPEVVNAEPLDQAGAEAKAEPAQEDVIPDQAAAQPALGAPGVEAKAEPVEIAVLPEANVEQNIPVAAGGAEANAEPPALGDMERVQVVDAQPSGDEGFPELGAVDYDGIVTGKQIGRAHV